MPLLPTLPAPARKSVDDCRAVRSAGLAALPRTGTSPVTDGDALVRRVEDIAFALGEMKASQDALGAADAWMLGDLLDDVLDVLDAVRAARSTR